MPVETCFWRRRGRNLKFHHEKTEELARDHTQPNQSLQTGAGFGPQNPNGGICPTNFRMEHTAPGPGNPARLTVGGRHQLLPDHLLRPELCLARLCRPVGLYLVATAPRNETYPANGETWE